MKIKNNRILLVEKGNLLLWLLVRRYKMVYFYSGQLPGAEPLSEDILNQMDLHWAYYRAGLVIDRVYKRYINENEANVLNEQIGDEHAYLIIKKTIRYALGRLYFSALLAEEFIKKYHIKERIDLIPQAFSSTMYKIISQDDNLLDDRVHIPSWYIVIMRIYELIKNFVYRWALILYPLVFSLLMKKGKPHKIHKRSYLYGFHIWNSSFIFSNPSYLMKFFQDKDSINPSNTLYIMDRPMNRVNLQMIKSLNYDCCYFSELIRKSNIWNYFMSVYPKIRKTSKILFFATNSKMLLTESYLKSLRWSLLWEIFYSHYNVKTFLSIQEPGQTGRELVQKRKDTKTMFIFMSTSYDSLYRNNMNASMDTFYGSLVFDAMISSKMSIEYIRKNENFIKRYYESGVLWSDIVFNIRQDNFLKEKIKTDLKIPKDKCIISFFDTSIGGTGIFNNQEGLNVIDSIFRLLVANKDYYLIYKSNGIDRLLMNRYIKEAVAKLIAHERVLCVNRAALNYTPQHIMGLSDLVIGVFTSSAPVESVVGGVRSVCYVPSERFNKDVFVFNTFPRFCAFGYDELQKYANYWLHQCSNADFTEFQNTYIKKYVDSYCDGKAMTRLHKILKQCDETKKKI